MNVYNFIVKTYGAVYNRPHIPYWTLSPVRNLLRVIANFTLSQILENREKVENRNNRSSIIVSFTSFPARINNVWQVVECMLRQTYQPDKIILWLSKEQFPTADSIPPSLRDREGEIFQIRIVDGDIRSHKKYYYVSNEYPDALIFLIDDDIYYPTDLLERTLKAHEEHPDCVICNYGYHIGRDAEGMLQPYNSWQHEYKNCTSNDLFFGSGGGTLFRPSELYKDLTNIELARELCPIADDIWLNAMVKLAGKPLCILSNGLILPVYSKGDSKLATENMGEGMNDVQIKAVTDYYKTSIF